MESIKLGNLEVAEVEGHKTFRCLKCRYNLCPISDDYKDFALKNETAISKGQPTYLASGTDKFVLKEYYCPQCATMFEVNMVAKDEKQIPSAKFRLP